MLTNSEIAALVLVGALIVWGLANADARKSFGVAVQAFFHRSIVTAVLLYLAYSGLLVWLAFLMGAWNVGLLKDTILITLTIGLPMVFNATAITDGGSLTRKTVRDVLGLSALVAFYVNLAPPSAIGVTIQIVASIALVISVPLKYLGKERPGVTRVLNIFLVGAGFLLITMATLDLVHNWPNNQQMAAIASALALSIWLPLALLPFMYVLAFYATCESLFVMLPLFNDRKKPHWKVRLAILIGFHGSIRFASNFAGHWRSDIAKLTSFREVRRVMGEYRASVRAEAAKKTAAVKRLRDNAGVDGVDEDGRRLDQREFEGTKKFLEELAMFQMGQHRNRLHHYNPDLLTVMGRGGQFGLPDEHGAEMSVSTDKQRWYAWRRTISGWVLGAGGTKNIDERWVYEGDEPPRGYPSHSSGWVTTDDLSTAPDWQPESAPSVAD